MKDEVWLKAKGFNHHKVSNKGGVINTKTGNRVKHSVSKGGTHSVPIYENGKTKTKRVAELVLDNFTKGSHKGNKIIYLDGNKANLSLSNLKSIDKKGKRVLWVDKNITFRNREECMVATGIPASALSSVLRGHSKSYKGMRFIELD